MRVTPQLCIGSLLASEPELEVVFARWGVRLRSDDLALSLRGLCEVWDLPLPALLGELDEALASLSRDIEDDEVYDPE